MRNNDTAWQHMLVFFEKVSNVTKGKINRGSWPIKRLHVFQFSLSLYKQNKRTDKQTNTTNKQKRTKQSDIKILKKRDLLHASLFREKMSKENLI